MATVQTDTFTTSDETNSQLVVLSQKYLGNRGFALSGTSTGYIGVEITPLAPWTNLNNRYFPTVATIPQVSGNIVTKGDIGGYFTPNNLGVSTYQTKNITSFIDISKIQAGTIYNYIDPTKFNKGRSSTQKDQDNIIIHSENKDWIKESFTDSIADGNVKNSNIYQKFIPYQSNVESQKTDTNGVITIKDNFEYWTGAEKNIWIQDNKFNELDWLRYFDIDIRNEYNIITPNKELYSWHTDVYGNQYALYKPTLSARSIYDMQNSFGELWVKLVDGSIYKAVDALSAVYNKYVNQPTIYSQLTGNYIKNFEVYFDTLIIQLSGMVLFEKIIFNYDTVTISNNSVQYLNIDFSSDVSTRLLSSTSLTSINVIGEATPYYGGIWYHEPEKKFITCLLLSTRTNNGVSGLVVPVLYEYDINVPAQRKRIYPTNKTDYSEYTYYYGASAAGDPDKEYLTHIESPVLTYNKSTNAYFVTFIAYHFQYFRLINYSTIPSSYGNVVSTETNDPIVTETNNTIQVV